MQSIAIRGMWEYMKMKIHEVVSWWTTTTYVWTAFMFHTDEHRNYKSAWDTAKPIWKIKKTVETVSWWDTDTDTFFPLDSNWKPTNEAVLIWDDVLSYTYL